MRIGVRDLLVLLLVVAVLGALMAWRRPAEPVATGSPVPVVVTASPVLVTPTPLVETPAPVKVKPKPKPLERKRKPPAPVYYPPPPLDKPYKPYQVPAGEEGGLIVE